MWEEKRMIMGRKNLVFGIFILFLGVAIIAAGFHLFLREFLNERVYWLNLVSVSIVYSVNVIHLFDFFGTRSKFDSEIAGLGLRIVLIPVYSSLVFACIWFSTRYLLEFEYQLYLHSILLFLLFLMLVVVNVATSRAGTVAQEENQLRETKANISIELDNFELWCVRGSEGSEAVSGLVSGIKEEMRYVSPTNNEAARKIDIEVLGNLKQAYKLSTQNQVSDAVPILNKCMDLIKVRKQTYSNN